MIHEQNYRKEIRDGLFPNDSFIELRYHTSKYWIVRQQYFKNRYTISYKYYFS